jgi:hypothetical protein
MVAQRLDLAGVACARRRASFRLQHAAHGKHLARLVADGAATKAPRAGSRRIRRFCDSWNSAWRTSVRDTPKWSASFCSASLVPGCRRCSTMARVSASTMEPVVDGSMQAS